MNKFLKAITSFDIEGLKWMLEGNAAWLQWKEKDGKNALHYLCGVPVQHEKEKQGQSLSILKFLVKKGMDINAVHSIQDKDCSFPATPLWYAYTRGRNEKIYNWLLTQGANPENCMYAIAWYDDTKAAALFHRHGAGIDPRNGKDSPFMAAFLWKKYSVAKWFLEHGADVNARDQDGNSTLYYAVKRKFPPEKIQLLVEYNADAHSKNNVGITPYFLARTKGPKKILELLDKYGSQPA